MLKTPRGLFNYILSGWPDILPAVQAFQVQVENLSVPTTADVVRSNITLFGLSELSRDVLAGDKRCLSLILRITDASLGGIQLDFGGGTCVASSFWGIVNGFDMGYLSTQYLSTLTAVASYDGFAAVTGSGKGLIQVVGYLEVSTGGTFIPRIAQATATGSLTIVTGSSIELR